MVGGRIQDLDRMAHYINVFFLAAELFVPAVVGPRGALALVQWLKLPAWKIEDAGLKPALAFKFQRNKMFLLRSLANI